MTEPRETAVMGVRVVDPGRKKRLLGHGWLNYLILAPLMLGILPFMERGPTLHFLFVAVTWAVGIRALLRVGGSRQLKVPVRICMLNLLAVLLFAVYNYFFHPPASGLQEVYYWSRRFLVYTRPSLYFLIGLWALRRGMRETATRFTVIGCGVFLTFFTLRVLQGRVVLNASIVYQFHNAFVACLSMVVLFYLMHLLTTREMPPWRYVGMTTLCIVLFAMPFFGFLRAASLIMIVLVTLMILLYGIRGKWLYIGALVVVAALALWMAVGETVGSLFSQNIYGYSGPLEVLQAATRIDDPNAVSRLTWWSESALPIFQSNPLAGSSFTAEFSIYSSDFAGSGVGYFHNYWVTMLVDGGLLLSIPHILLQLYPVFLGLALVRKGDKRPVPYVLWILAVTMTNFSNAWGHSTFHSEFEFLIFGIAAANIVAFKLDRKTARSRAVPSS